MKSTLFTIGLCCISLIGSSQNSMQDIISQDTVIINGGWRCTYLESPLYIKNKDYVVFQYGDIRKIIYPDMQSFRVINTDRDCAIAVDKNGIYFQDTFIDTDTTGIQIVGRNNEYRNQQWLWKTKDKVFNNTTELQGLDPETFQPIECFNGANFKDKNYVYYFDKKIEGSDGSTVNKSCGEVCYDKNYIYIKGEIATYNGEKLQSVNSILAKNSHVVINRSTMQPVEGIDAASIVKLSDRYAMDKNYVYYGATKLPIKKANLQNVKVWEQVNRAFVTDGISIYYRDAEFEVPEKNLDAKTFGMLPHSDFTYDKNGIYEREWVERKNKIILIKFPFRYTKPISSENIFFTDNNMYIIYENQVYDLREKKLYTDFNPQEIQSVKDGALLPIDKNEFEVDSPKLISIGYGYTKKGNSIYYQAVQLSGIQDPDSFKPLGYIYAKDKYKVYSLDTKYTSSKIKYILSQIERADINTFKQNILPFDNNSVYVGDQPIISSQDIEFLAVFSGYRPGCGMDRTPSTNYILMKNKDGFWFMETSYNFDEKVNLQYLGKTFNPKWNKTFEDFELAR